MDSSHPVPDSPATHRRIDDLAAGELQDEGKQRQIDSSKGVPDSDELAGELRNEGKQQENGFCGENGVHQRIDDLDGDLPNEGKQRKIDSSKGVPDSSAGHRRIDDLAGEMLQDEGNQHENGFCGENGSIPQHSISTCNHGGEVAVLPSPGTNKTEGIQNISAENQDSEGHDDTKNGIQKISAENHEFYDVDYAKNISIRAQINGHVQIIIPHSQLPKPEAPRGLSDFIPPNGYVSSPLSRSQSLSENMPSIGKFIRDKSSKFSTEISKRLSSLKDFDDDSKNNVSPVSEFNLSGLKVIVKVKGEEVKGRISFFSRSNCRDCTAVRTFFREKGLRFVEINVDVYPEREKELRERSGSVSVPQIFFNEKLFGGLVALNSLRNSGDFDRRLKEMLGTKCSRDAPAPPVYGFDDPDEDESTDEMMGIVRVLRQRLPIRDRLVKMKIVTNCFAGSEMVEVLIHHLDCGRRQAIEVGKQLARKHFIHHVFGGNDFEDGNHFYRFLEHIPFIHRCFNFRGSTNDCKPKPTAMVAQRLAKIMSAILESYASNDRQHVDYVGISNSEEFRRYVNLAQDLQRVNLQTLFPNEKLAFFLNLYNAMVIHAVIRGGRQEGVIDRKSFYSEFQYIVGGHPYALTTIKNGILRSNGRPPYALVKPFGTGDRRLELALPKVNPLIHFGLCNGTRSSPTVRFFTPQGVEAELRCAAREFFQRVGMEVNLDKRTVYLTRLIKWFNVDFGQEKEILKWIINYLDATKAGLLTHLLGDGGTTNIVYQDFDWSVNY